MSPCPSSSFPQTWEYEDCPGSPPARLAKFELLFRVAVSPHSSSRVPETTPADCTHPSILYSSRFLAGVRPGYPTQLRSLTDQLHEKNGPQTIRLRLFLENEPQAERVLRDSIGMVLHQLNGFMVFSLSSLSAAFQR
jgi:hypothetical protein